MSGRYSQNRYSEDRRPVNRQASRGAVGGRCSYTRDYPDDLCTEQVEVQFRNIYRTWAR